MIHWYWHVTTHKLWVLWYIFSFCLTLMKRALKHDLSKYGRKEAKAFSENLNRLRKVTYGGDEYKAILKDLEPTLKHHYSRNRHHPEHHYSGVIDMDLYDIVEMFCDWRASIKKHKNGNIHMSLEVNKKRFAMVYQLYQILKNTTKTFHEKKRIEKMF